MQKRFMILTTKPCGKQGRLADEDMKKKPPKTMYCDHWMKCDRDEDCKAGEDCIMFKFNPDCYGSVDNQEPPNLEKEMDKIWTGK